MATSDRGDCSGVAVRTCPLVWMVLASPEPSTNSHCGFFRGSCGCLWQQAVQSATVESPAECGGLEGGVGGWKCAGIL